MKKLGFVRNVLAAVVVPVMFAGVGMTDDVLQAQASPTVDGQQEYDWFGSRLKFRGYHLFNGYDQVRVAEDGTGGKLGYGLGAEIVLPNGLGFGVAGFTNGRVSEFEADVNHMVFTAELNYFLKIRPLRLAPFAGIHGGVVTYSGGEFGDFGWHDGFDDLGYQYGVRFQPFTLIGIDAQIRHLSGFAADPYFEEMVSPQFLLGVTLF